MTSQRSGCLSQVVWDGFSRLSSKPQVCVRPTGAAGGFCLMDTAVLPGYFSPVVPSSMLPAFLKGEFSKGLHTRALL